MRDRLYWPSLVGRSKGQVDEHVKHTETIVRVRGVGPTCGQDGEETALEPVLDDVDDEVCYEMQLDDEYVDVPDGVKVGISAGEYTDQEDLVVDEVQPGITSGLCVCKYAVWLVRVST